MPAVLRLRIARKLREELPRHGVRDIMADAFDVFAEWTGIAKEDEKRAIAANLIENGKLSEEEIAHVCDLELKDVRKLRINYDPDVAVTNYLETHTDEEIDFTLQQLIVVGRDAELTCSEHFFDVMREKMDYLGKRWPGRDIQDFLFERRERNIWMRGTARGFRRKELELSEDYDPDERAIVSYLKGLTPDKAEALLEGFIDIKIGETGYAMDGVEDLCRKAGVLEGTELDNQFLGDLADYYRWLRWK